MKLPVWLISLGGLAIIAGVIVEGMDLTHRVILPKHTSVKPVTFAKITPFLPPAESSSRTASQQLVWDTPILMYHYVEYVKDPKDTIRKSLDILPTTFEAQIATLKNHGYTFITMRHLGEALKGTYTMPKKPIILTFDDGYKDFYTDVFPILKKYDVPATAYVISHFLGKPNYMSAEDITEIAASGLVEIAGHTQDHQDLRHKLPDTLEREIVGGKRDLEAITHTPLASFAYPYGGFDQDARTIVAGSGYMTAVSTNVSSVRQFDQWTIDRIRPGAMTGETLVHHIESILASRAIVFSHATNSGSPLTSKN